MALRAEERRDKLRKAAGRSKYPLIRRYLNGETHMRRPHVPYTESIGIRREPGELKHLSSRRKRKKNRFSKKRRANGKEAKPKGLLFGVRTAFRSDYDSRKVLERPVIEGESPVCEIQRERAESRVPRDTRNLVGMSGDHPVRLNTP